MSDEQNEREKNQGWRLRSGWVERQIREGCNPHFIAAVRMFDLEYWHLNQEHGAGDMIYYNFLIGRRYQRASPSPMGGGA